MVSSRGLVAGLLLSILVQHCCATSSAPGPQTVYAPSYQQRSAFIPPHQQPHHLVFIPRSDPGVLAGLNAPGRPSSEVPYYPSSLSALLQPQNYQLTQTPVVINGPAGHLVSQQRYSTVPDVGNLYYPGYQLQDVRQVH